MRTVILMKMINCNNLFYQPIPITDKLILANGDSLYYNFIFTIFGGPARLYHRLGSMLYNILDEGGYFDVLYNILDEGNYFDVLSNILDKDGYFDEDN
ncbi:hypothetical protein AVV41_gp134 [Microcystis phage MaMV-DC]|uniref:Uncharacterized protein n=1 Tax=Microcystis phage MaMV-DC TaxID=1357715 RepID=A0A075BU79_9CAUD|nr:hypothetical protein AVV41_gp134 [Microcystis phage MaMV-DC]AGR48699.1 hypothetical protein MaMVDC_134 [Microcystis phage MaMV-DC]